MNGLSIFLDSGAFSAFSQNLEIKIDDYVSFIYRNIDIIDEYANLDVIGDAKRTLENQKYMESCGLLPIPVFHIHEDYSYLKYYVDNYEYIGIGGMAQVRKKDILYPWLDHCFSIICDNEGFPKVKTHGFALTKFSLMARYPWYSVDSSSWLFIARNCRIAVVTNSPGSKVKVIPISHPDRLSPGKHLFDYSKGFQRRVLKLITEKGFALGKSTLKTVDKDYIVDKSKENLLERNKDGTKLIEVISERGLSNSRSLRIEWNIKFFMELEKHFPTYPWRFVPKIKRKSIL